MMFTRTLKSKTDGLKSHDQAVSEVVGGALLLGIVLTGTMLILLLGSNVLDGARSSATLNGVEQAFTMADSRLSKARFSTAISQDAPFEVNGGVVNVNASWDDSHIVIYDFDNITKTTTEIYNQTLGTIKCTTNDGVVAYQDGGVWLLDNTGGSVMLSPPDFDYNGITLTLPVMHIKGNASLTATGGAKVIIGVKSSDPINIYPSAKYSNPIPAQHFINISIKSDYYLAWADYINERTRAAAEMDANKKIVNVSLKTAVGRQGGTVDDGFNTKSMDTTFDAPILSFSMNLLHPSSGVGNEYQVDFGSPSSYPQLTIYIGRTTGGINQDKDQVLITYNKANHMKEEWMTCIDFQRKIDDSFDVNLLNRSMMMDYTSDSLPQSQTWGDDTVNPDTGPTTPIPEYVDPAHPEVSYDPNNVPQKSLYDIIQHYMLIMAKNDQASGTNQGSTYAERFNGNKVDSSSKFYLEYVSNQDLKYFFITDGTLETNLATGG